MDQSTRSTGQTGPPCTIPGGEREQRQDGREVFSPPGQTDGLAWGGEEPRCSPPDTANTPVVQVVEEHTEDGVNPSIITSLGRMSPGSGHSTAPWPLAETQRAIM